MNIKISISITIRKVKWDIVYLHITVYIIKEPLLGIEGVDTYSKKLYFFYCFSVDVNITYVVEIVLRSSAFIDFLPLYGCTELFLHLIVQTMLPIVTMEHSTHITTFSAFE